jgi:uncharacterized membrane protein
MNKRRAAANASAEWAGGTDDKCAGPLSSPRPVKAPAEQLSTQWRRTAAFATVACCNLTVAAFSSVPVVATGLMAWRWQLEGQKLKGTLLLHLLLGVASSALIWLVWWLHFRGRKPERKLPRYRLPLEALAAAVVALTAHLGGFLSGINAPV